MRYRAEVIQELPGQGFKQYYFPGGDQSGGGDGLLVRVHPEAGEPWVGVFKYGYPSPKALSGVFEWPDPDLMCVVSKGRGYIVDANDPSHYSEISAFPITAVAPIPEKGLVILCDFLKIVAYSSKGLAWETPRLSWDGLKILGVTPDVVSGEAWDAAADRWVPFTIEVETGRHQGGASPETSR